MDFWFQIPSIIEADKAFLPTYAQHGRLLRSKAEEDFQ